MTNANPALAWLALLIFIPALIAALTRLWRGGQTPAACVTGRRSAPSPRDIKE